MARCNECGLQYTNPRIRESDIARYYFPEYTTRWPGKLKGEARRFIEKTGWIGGNSHRRAFETLRSAGARSVLEIGPGGGELLRFLRDRGIEAVGVETDAGCATALQKSGIECLHGRLESVMGCLTPGEFDAVILCHVFEHLYRPDETLRNIRILLREEGIIYLTLPDSGSFEAKLFGKYWRGLDLPRHIIHYDVEKIEAILARNGFEIVESGNCVFPSSFVESIGFLVLRGKKMPKPLYYSLYYPCKLVSTLVLGIMGSGVIRVVARKTAG